MEEAKKYAVKGNGNGIKAELGAKETKSEVRRLQRWQSKEAMKSNKVE